MASMALAAGVAAQKPYPIYTVDHFVDTMKTLGPNFAGVNASLATDDYNTAKARLMLARQQLATTITFWRDNERDDAVALLRSALERIDALDDTLSKELLDSAAMSASATEVEAACEACHEVYRVRDPATQEYRIRPGVLP